MVTHKSIRPALTERPPLCRDSATALFRRRSAGLLLHITSLPGRHGSGDLGANAHRFIDFLAAAGQSWWQMLPVGPPGDPPGNSPYSSCSSVAGSPYLISLDPLYEEGWLTRHEVLPDPRFAAEQVQFQLVRSYRQTRLRQAWARFQTAKPSRREAFTQFCARHRGWLDNYALYLALKQRFGQAPWPQWPQDLRRRRPAALAEARRTCQPEMAYHCWIQYLFDRQWTALLRHAHRCGVALMGDLPMFVSHDSVDVWAHPELFKLGPQGWPTRISGYPPDAFCRLGQRWGHPQYHWAAHGRSGFRWWVARFAGAYRRFDAIRLDHFLGLTRLWSIPASAHSGKHGRWVRTPGRELLNTVRHTLGQQPMIAEDLGHVTPADIALRDDFGMPAMRILQWGLGPGDPLHRPHRFSPHTVAYTGTHDTDTVVGWFEGLPARAKRQVLTYTGGDGSHIHLDLIRLAFNSAANTVIVPVQDLLALDGQARMNRPGTPSGNWGWRVRANQLTAGLAANLRRMTESSERLSEVGSSCDSNGS